MYTYNCIKMHSMYVEEKLCIYKCIKMHGMFVLGCCVHTRPQESTPLDNGLHLRSTGPLKRLHHTALHTSRVHPYVTTTGYKCHQ